MRTYADVMNVVDALSTRIGSPSRAGAAAAAAADPRHLERDDLPLLARAPRAGAAGPDAGRTVVAAAFLAAVLTFEGGLVGGDGGVGAEGADLLLGRVDRLEGGRAAADVAQALRLGQDFAA